MRVKQIVWMTGGKKKKTLKIDILSDTTSKLQKNVIKIFLFFVEDENDWSLSIIVEQP